MKTLTEHMNDYLSWRRSLKLSPETIAKNKYSIEPFIRWFKSTYTITTPDKIYREHLTEWQKHIAEKKTDEGHLIKPRTINTYVECIRGYLHWLADNGQIRKDFADIIRPVKKPVTLPGNVLEHDKIRRLLNSIDTGSLTGYRDRTMLELLYSSGVRSAELLGLDIFDVDLTNRIMPVTGKGNKQRVLPIGKTAVKFLETYLKAIRPYMIVDRAETALFLT